jgi:2-dehydro-3-deoxygluconokinase
MTIRSKVLFIGEAMLELVQKSDDLLARSFAGDVYNTAVYLSRAYDNVDASFLTGAGTDRLSEQFIAKVKDENIGTQHIALSDSKHLGTYMVVNDETGERSFIYWRNDSAAKSMMSLLSEKQQTELLSQFSEGDSVFFSGITLAILHPVERDKLFELLTKLKQNGVQIIFDPNYRPVLWESKDVAKQNIERAFSISQMLMPGLDDFASLYGFTSVQECIDFCQAYDFTELVFKQGPESVHVVNSTGHHEIDIVKSDNVVDTTSAGDAFNGIYLGARLQGQSPQNSTKLANYAASKVIETPGAIMPHALFTQKWAQKPQV